MLMVPFITIIMSNRGVAPDLAVKMAIATSMATIIFTSISSVWAHHKRGAVRWDIVKRLAPGIVAGSLAGSLGLFAMLKGSYLAIFFGLFVGFSATQMFLDKKPKPARQLPGTGGPGSPRCSSRLISRLDRGKSGLHRARWWVTPTWSNPRE
jgi:uncharacterized membrane protein YfcA